MTEELQIELQPDELKNAAVARCCRAWQLAYDQEMELEYGDGWDDGEYRNDSDARRAANKAFRDAMPPLVGLQNIRDFIACVACGLLKEAISGLDAPRLLYAAQIAVSAGGGSKSSRP
jgi:hypothetical protein